MHRRMMAQLKIWKAIALQVHAEILFKLQAELLFKLQAEQQGGSSCLARKQ